MKLRKSKYKNLIKSVLKFNTYDYAYLLSIEKQALICMKDYFSNSNIAVSDKEVAKDLDLAIKLLDIILEIDNSYTYSFPGKFHSIKYVNTKNAYRFLSGYKFDFSSPVIKDALRVEKAWHLYNRLRELKMRHWWN